MKLPILGMLVALLPVASVAADGTGPAIVPLPQKIESRPGVFGLKTGQRETKIVADAACKNEAQYLAGELHRITGTEFKVGMASNGPRADGDILLTVKDAHASLGPEGYELKVTPESVVIRAPDAAGVFYGIQTFLQLMPPVVTEGTSKAAPEISCVQIEDQPRFRWRGLMLDVSRHFFPKAEVMKILDGMAMYKLNTFHWHLTDDQGWRIEIDKYPLLTRDGAWRKGVGFGLDPKSGESFGPDGRYGGYYTKADIREVVAYAAARHITIVPEIEMPGHSSAALKGYPQFSCTGGPFTTDLPGGVFDGIYCVGNDESFAFMENVLTEVIELFPGKYVHVGGDEVLTTNWANCAKCQALMKREGMKKEMELESYFIRRIEKFLNAHNRSLIGWSEIREGGLSENAAVMDWVGGAVEAASAGHDVVMSPLKDCYFDHYQSENHSTEPHAIGGYLPLSQVYAFEPMPANLAPEYQKHILGAQANVWTEYMPSLKHVEYMIFPRACALAEVVWSPKASRNWDDFSRRLQAQYGRLDAIGINYRHPAGLVAESGSTK
jgi:hexosaminidase